MMPLLALLSICGIGLAALNFGLDGPFLVAIVALPAVVWALRRPLHFAAITIASIPWGILATNGITVFKILTAVLLPLVVYHIRREGRSIQFPKMAGGVFILIALLTAISELSSEYGASLEPALELAAVILLFLALSQVVRSAEDLRVLATVQAFNMVFVGIYVFREVGWARMMSDNVRALGPNGQPNSLAEHILRNIAFSLALTLDRDARLSLRVVGAAGVVLAVYANFAAASRSGSLGIVVAVACFGFFSVEGVSKRAFRVAMVVAAIVFAVAISPKSFESRVVDTFRQDQTKSGKNTLYSERVEHAEFAMKMIPKHPWLGWGGNGFAKYRAYTVGGRETALHSMIFGLATAFGVITLAICLGTLAAAVYSGIRELALCPKRDRSYVAAVVAGLTAGLVASAASPQLFVPELWALGSICFILLSASRRAEMAAKRGLTPRAPTVRARPVLVNGTLRKGLQVPSTPVQTYLN